MDGAPVPLPGVMIPSQRNRRPAAAYEQAPALSGKPQVLVIAEH